MAVIGTAAAEGYLAPRHLLPLVVVSMLTAMRVSTSGVWARSLSLNRGHLDWVDLWLPGAALKLGGNVYCPHHVHGVDDVYGCAVGLVFV